MPKKTVLLLSFCLMSEIVAANNTTYVDMIPTFWRYLYPTGGVSLYCGDKFTPQDRRHNIEHVFPMAWVTRSLKCGTRKQCRKKSPVFNAIEMDMHNLYPARASVNEQRGAYGFTEIPGEYWYVSNCDFEIDNRRFRVEPRESARGEIARSLLYMADQWRLPLFAKQKKLMLKWHEDDPVTDAEIRRNQAIYRLQGRSNHWVVGRPVNR